MDLQYEIRVPEKILPETPLLVLLHGYGSNEQDLFSFAPTLPQDWIIVSFQAPITIQYGGFAWYDIDLMNIENRVNPAQAQQSMNAVLQGILDIKQTYKLAGGPVHLCGFSQGGILSYALALKNPQLFSKIACLSSYPEEKLLTEAVKDKKKLSHLRFFVSHGTEDAVIPLEWARKGAELLYDLGCFFSFREYAGGHGVNQKNYMDLMEFLAK